MIKWAGNHFLTFKLKIMAYIPISVRQGAFPENGPQPIHRGKVRDTYSLTDYGYSDLLLVWTSDRISIFDFILGMLIPGKGKILNLISTFWKLYLRKKIGIQTDLVAWGERIDTYLPKELRGNPDLWARATIVKKQKMVLWELIVRKFLTGTGFKDYLKNGQVCGIKLPLGLYDGAELQEPIFTPSTKAEVGHDENINRNTVVEKFGIIIEDTVINIFNVISETYRQVGLVLIDTKFELGYGDSEITFNVSDEVATPDSSRIADGAEVEKAKIEHRPAIGFDKQYMRNKGKIFGINDETKFDPKIEAHCIKVGELVFSDEDITKTQALYLEIGKRLSPKILEMKDPALTKMLYAVLEAA